MSRKIIHIYTLLLTDYACFICVESGLSRLPTLVGKACRSALRQKRPAFAACDLLYGYLAIIMFGVPSSPT